MKKKYIKYAWFVPFNKLISFALRFITIPDHMVLWNFTAIPKALKIFKQNNINAVIVSSPPNSSLLTGYFLQRFKKIPFIADLRDPIVGNIAEVELNRSSKAINRIEKKIRVWYKRLILTRADKIIANTETHRKQLAEDYGEKVFTIRNAYDPEEYAENLADWRNEQLNIAHFGSIYGMRSGNLLFRALKRLEENRKEELKIQVNFYGIVSDELNQDIKKYQVEKYVAVKGLIAHTKAINLMQKTDYLLLIKAAGPGSEGQIPGKFFEYIGARRPILCLGPIDSEVSRLINENGLGTVIENDEREMYEYLFEIYDAFLAGDKKYLDKNIAEKFSAVNMGNKFVKVLDTLS